MNKIKSIIAIILTLMCLLSIVGCSIDNYQQDGGFVPNKSRGKWVELDVDGETYKFRIVNEESEWDILKIIQEDKEPCEHIQIYEYGGSHKPFTNSVPEFTKDLKDIKSNVSEETHDYNVIRKDDYVIEIYTENKVEHSYRTTSIIIITFNNKSHYLYFKTDESFENIKRLMSDIEIA